MKQGNPTAKIVYKVRTWYVYTGLNREPDDVYGSFLSYSVKCRM